MALAGGYHSSLGFARCFIVVICSTDSFDDKGFAQFKDTSDLTPFGIIWSGETGSSIKTTHNSFSFYYTVHHRGAEDTEKR